MGGVHAYAAAASPRPCTAQAMIIGRPHCHRNVSQLSHARPQSTDIVSVVYGVYGVIRTIPVSNMWRVLEAVEEIFLKTSILSLLL